MYTAKQTGTFFFKFLKAALWLPCGSCCVRRKFPLTRTAYGESKLTSLEGSFRKALSWECSTSSLKVNGAAMISFIRLLSSGLMALCSHVDTFHTGWMSESLDKMRRVRWWPRQQSALRRGECQKFSGTGFTTEDTCILTSADMSVNLLVLRG